MRLTILAALAAAVFPVAAQAQTEPAMKGPFYSTGTGASGESIIAMGTRERDGDLARITRVIMLPKPADAAGLVVWRIDAIAEFDCKKQLTRPLVLAARDDKGKLVHIFDNKEGFEELQAGDPTVVAALTVACTGNPPPGAPKIDDFDAWQAKYRAEHSGGQ